MEIGEIISPSRVRCAQEVRSKKAVLEMLAELIAEADPDLGREDVFNSLLSRERLGSTGLGHGVAIPHGRVQHGHRTLGAFVQARSAIDFDAIDREPVDLFFALLVPEQSTEEHLQVLARLAEMFSQDRFLEELRAQSTPEAVHALLARGTVER